MSFWFLEANVIYVSESNVKCKYFITRALGLWVAVVVPTRLFVNDLNRGYKVLALKDVYLDSTSYIYVALMYRRILSWDSLLKNGGSLDWSYYLLRILSDSHHHWSRRLRHSDAEEEAATGVGSCWSSAGSGGSEWRDHDDPTSPVLLVIFLEFSPFFDLICHLRLYCS